MLCLVLALFTAKAAFGSGLDGLLVGSSAGGCANAAKLSCGVSSCGTVTWSSQIACAAAPSNVFTADALTAVDPVQQLVYRVTSASAPSLSTKRYLTTASLFNSSVTIGQRLQLQHSLVTLVHAGGSILYGISQWPTSALIQIDTATNKDTAIFTFTPAIAAALGISAFDASQSRVYALILSGSEYRLLGLAVSVQPLSATIVVNNPLTPASQARVIQTMRWSLSAGLMALTPDGWFSIDPLAATMTAVDSIPPLPYAVQSWTGLVTEQTDINSWLAVSVLRETVVSSQLSLYTIGDSSSSRTISAANNVPSAINEWLPSPTVSSLSVNGFAISGSGSKPALLFAGANVTITGANFNAATGALTCSLDSAPLAVQVVSATRAYCIVPAQSPQPASRTLAVSAVGAIVLSSATVKFASDVCGGCAATGSACPTTASSNGWKCSCQPGFAGADASPASVNCAACPLGKFTAIAGQQSCSQCAANTFGACTNNTSGVCCKSCYRNSVSSGAAIGCDCDVGYQTASGTGFATSDTSCQACAAGKFKPARGPQQCQQCPSLSTSLQAASSCVCKPGAAINSTAPFSCVACNPGTFKNATINSSCSVCEVNTFSFSGLSKCLKCPPSSDTRGQRGLSSCTCTKTTRQNPPCVADAFAGSDEKPSATMQIKINVPLSQFDAQTFLNSVADSLGTHRDRLQLGTPVADPSGGSITVVLTISPPTSADEDAQDTLSAPALALELYRQIHNDTAKVSPIWALPGTSSIIESGQPQFQAPPQTFADKAKAALSTDLLYIIQAAAFAVIMLICYLLKRCSKDKDARWFDLVTVLLAVYAIVTDILFIASVTDSPEFLAPTLLFTILPFLVNLTITFREFRKQLQADAFYEWANKNQLPLTVVLIISATNVNCLAVLTCHILDFTFFSAPWDSKNYRLNLEKLGPYALLGLALDDVPQLIIRAVYAKSTDAGVSGSLALFSAGGSVLFGSVKNVLIWLLLDADRARQRRQASSSSPTPTASPSPAGSGSTVNASPPAANVQLSVVASQVQRQDTLDALT